MANKRLRLFDQWRKAAEATTIPAGTASRWRARRFYVKQVESGDVSDFSRMSTEELRAYVYGDDELPPRSPTGAVAGRVRRASGGPRLRAH